MSNFILRDANASDREAIRNVTLAAYEQYARVLPDYGWREYRTNILETLEKVAPAEQIVAERGGDILGTVLLYPRGTQFDVPDGTKHTFEFPEIRLLAVSPSARGQGIGEALTRECMARARRAGNRAITLHTTDLMSVAMQMYERMGFVRAPELDFQPDPNFLVKGYRYTFEMEQ